MSRISITGSKPVMDDVIETVHDLNLLHITDYDESWEGFEPGDPLPGSEEASSKLVTVRSIESILDLDAEDVAGTASVSPAEAEARLEEIRQEVNELDDRKDELRNELRRVDERLEQMEIFADLGIDLDLLRDYRSIDVAVGEGDPARIESALEDADDVGRYEVFAGSDAVAIAAEVAADGQVTDALVSVPFTVYEVPEAGGDPNEYVSELERDRRSLENELETVENELESLKLESADFLLALEEELSIEVDKAEAPLRFATTERSFVAEGWIPTDRFEDLESALAQTVGDHVELIEHERADYDEHGHASHTEDVEDPGQGPPAGEAATEGDVAATDGGREHTPPVVQDNPEPAKPFEVLVTMINRPKYTELDPTLIVFLTFPFAYGFMIGDMGYGLLYMLMGWFMYRLDSDVLSALGVIGMWAGAFTVLFGYLYDDIFGVHTADLGLEFLPLAGSLHKGLHAYYGEWALLWIVLSILFGILHLNVGFVFGFINDRAHGVWEAFTENLSWFLMVNGFFLWVFSTHAVGQKPNFIVGEESVLAFFFGFTGLPEVAGLVGLAGFGLGVVLALVAEGGIALVETVTVTLANTLSYLRITAVLLAKAGMAFVVNLLVFGAYAEPRESPTGEEVEYVVFHLPGADVSGMTQEFVGLIHVEPAVLGVLAAIVIFVLGHILVLLLGITAAGIQMLRLEYVEFFGKFYEGGGEKFEPFGYQRTYTEDS